MDILNWILTPSSKLIAWDLILLISLFDCIYLFLMVNIIVLPSRNLEPSFKLAEEFKNILFEEATFRFLPLVLSRIIAIKIGNNILLLLCTAVISSVIFGYLHGHWKYVFNQGVGGFLYCLLFLKTGGLDFPSLKTFQAFLNVVVIHSLFNYTILAIIALIIFSKKTNPT